MFFDERLIPPSGPMARLFCALQRERRRVGVSISPHWPYLTLSTRLYDWYQKTESIPLPHAGCVQDRLELGIFGRPTPLVTDFEVPFTRKSLCGRQVMSLSRQRHSSDKTTKAREQPITSFTAYASLDRGGNPSALPYQQHNLSRRAIKPSYGSPHPHKPPRPESHKQTKATSILNSFSLPRNTSVGLANPPHRRSALQIVFSLQSYADFASTHPHDSPEQLQHYRHLHDTQSLIKTPYASTKSSRGNRKPADTLYPDRGVSQPRTHRVASIQTRRQTNTEA